MKCLTHPLINLLQFRDELKEIKEHCCGPFCCLLDDTIGVRTAEFSIDGLIVNQGHRDYRLTFKYRRN